MPTYTFVLGEGADGGGAGNDDTTALYQHSSWPASGGSFSDNNDAGVVFIYKDLNSGTYYSSTGLFRWHTAAIGAGGYVPTSAIFKPYIVGPSFGTADTWTVVGKYHVWGPQPSTAGDWIETATPSIWTPVTQGAITLDAQQSWPLTDLSGINVSGWTEIAVTLSSFTPTGYNEIHIRENVGIGNYAELEVTYDFATEYNETVQQSRRFGPF